MSDYPEHAKLEAIRDRSQAIGEFLDSCGYTVCDLVCVRCGAILTGPKREDHGGCDGDTRYLPLRQSIERTLAEYFGIDLDKIEQERRTMLEVLREGHNGG